MDDRQQLRERIAELEAENAWAANNQSGATFSFPAWFVRLQTSSDLR
jgi:hypothetical protein